MEQGLDYVSLFDRNIRSFFGDTLRLSLRDPAMALFVWQTIRRQQRAARLRQAWRGRGVHVPPFMIASITRRCNLHCQGCYARAQQPPAEAEMSPATLRSAFAEAQALGISIILIAGGEPLTHPDILDITRERPGVIFPLFTNGLLLDQRLVARLKRQRNVVPVLSLEGHEIDTDRRRGAGVHSRLLQTMGLLRRHGVFFGTSLTVTRLNFATVTGEAFVRELLAAGCRLFFFVDYVPVQPGTESLILAAEQRAAEAEIMASLRAALPGLFVAFPGDEAMYGGCLAAGRGFIHLSAEGHVEPCPFSPFSDSSLRHLSLRQALESDLLRTIRDGSERLGEARGGCALWENREWVESLLAPAAPVSAGLETRAPAR